MKIIRVTAGVVGFFIFWQLAVILLHSPAYLLPLPTQIFRSLFHFYAIILTHAIPTVIETLLGLVIGCVVGIVAALLMTVVKPVRTWMLPVVLVSQAIPTFAIAPILVLWFGYGMTSKIIVTVIMLFFPVTSSFFDGLSKVPQAWLDIAVLNQGSRWHTLRYIKIPAALPNLASGVRVAAAIAPIGAIIGEWVGASRGLGYLMLNASARMQTDLMFACLLLIVVMALGLYALVDYFLEKLIWRNREC